MIKHHLQDYIPFMLAVGSDRPSFSTVRIIEALIIAGLTAVGAGYVTQAVMKNELKHLTVSQQENRDEIRNLAKSLESHLQWELDRASRNINP